MTKKKKNIVCGGILVVSVYFIFAFMGEQLQSGAEDVVNPGRVRNKLTSKNESQPESKAETKGSSPQKMPAGITASENTNERSHDLSEKHPGNGFRSRMNRLIKTGDLDEVISLYLSRYGHISGVLSTEGKGHPLFLYLLMKDADLAMALYEQGDVDLNRFFYSSMKIAVITNKNDFFQFLLDEGFDPLARTDEYASLIFRDIPGISVGMSAVLGGNYEALKLIDSYGYNFKEDVLRGRDLLELAATTKHQSVEIQDFLISNGLEYTPHIVSEAARFGNEETLQNAYELNPALIDSVGVQSLIDMAVSGAGDIETIALLVSYGAEIRQKHVDDAEARLNKEVGSHKEDEAREVFDLIKKYQANIYGLFLNYSDSLSTV